MGGAVGWYGLRCITAISVCAFAAGVGAQVINEDLKITAPDGASGDAFGIAVALDGTTAVVGAREDDDDGLGSGSAYLIDITTGNQLHKLLADDGAQGDEFGFGVGIGGGLAIVGARYDTDNGSGSGSAYLFDTSTGQQVHKLLPDDGAANAAFGIAVDTNGQHAVIGAFFDPAGGTFSGAAYIFDASTGKQVHKLVPDDGQGGDVFGIAVSIDGGTVAVGAAFANNQAGAVYLFDVATGQQIRKIQPPGIPSGANFGVAVDLRGDLLAAGAIGETDAGSMSGAAYLMDASTGNQIHRITPNDLDADDEFGSSVAIDDGVLAVGAFGESDNGSDAGAAYLFDLATGDQIVKLLASDGEANDFMSSVGLDEGRCIAGAPYASDLGAVYVYSVPTDCLADTNGDGALTPADFTAWINAYNNQLPACDQNADGSCTPADFTAWINNYNQGC